MSIIDWYAGQRRRYKWAAGNLAQTRNRLLRENAALRKNFMFAESEIILLREDREELRELAARMAKEMRETDHEFCSLVDYDNLQNKI